MESYAVSFEEATDLFQETLAWLWLIGTTPGGLFVVDHSLTSIDEMWHTFILFTREYSAFCERNFGRYIHHAPTTYLEKQQARANPRRARAELRTAKRRMMGLVYDRLGEATLVKWFSSLPAWFATIEERTCTS